MKLVGPEPQRFVVADGENPEHCHAAFVTIIRGGAGALALGYKTSLVRETPENKGNYTLASLPGGFRLAETSTAANFPRPAKPLVIYDAQDANSRKIREAICILDLDTMFKPCPEGANTHKKELSDRSGSSSSSIQSVSTPTTALNFLMLMRLSPTYSATMETTKSLLSSVKDLLMTLQPN